VDWILLAVYKYSAESFRWEGVVIFGFYTASSVEFRREWHRQNSGVACGLNTAGCVEVHWVELELGVV
jgi:hypothetical protein